MKWIVERICQYSREELLRKNGIHSFDGKQYVINSDERYCGCLLNSNTRYIWTIGSDIGQNTNFHIDISLKFPISICESSNSPYLIIADSPHDSENSVIYRADPFNAVCEPLILCEEYGIKNVSCCQFDSNGNIWISELSGCRIWQFDQNGNPILKIGNGEPGFQLDTVSFDEARFNWIYCIKNDSQGNIYILDSKNYSIRLIDVYHQTVSTILGDGNPGSYNNDTDPKRIRLGSSKEPLRKYDGPWYITVDENDNIFIADTYNHIIRYFDTKKNLVSTIAGNYQFDNSYENNSNEKDPLALHLKHTCFIDYFDQKLYIPEWDGSLIVLSKIEDNYQLN